MGLNLHRGFESLRLRQNLMLSSLVTSRNPLVTQCSGGFLLSKAVQLLLVRESANPYISVSFVITQVNSVVIFLYQHMKEH